MRGPHNLWRLIRTGATFERTGAMAIVLEGFGTPPGLRLAARVLAWPFSWLGLRGDPALPPVTRALTALGPAYIKFGQTLATRPDIVGTKMAQELKYLQDQLPPFGQAQARAMIEAELGLPLDQMFSSFSEPVAAASIAQVHKARLVMDGREVAVKVLRPGIERAFQKDIDAFYFAARTIEVLAPFARRLRPMDVITHFEGLVVGELDLRLEAAAASEFASNTGEDAGFQVPQPVWRLSGKSVMTLDWCEGINMADNAALDAAGYDRKALGARVLQLFLSHALRDGLFHGDMHQGNMKVAANGDIIAFDFGIMGRIDPYTRRVYAEILFGFIQRNYRRVAEVHFEAGYVPADRDVEAFASALRAVGEPIFGMEATQISMAKLLAYLFDVTERFGMETRTELILLQRTMVVVEGVARGLDPNINIWQVAKPVVEDYIARNLGPVALLRDLGRTAQVLARFGPKLPKLMEDFLIRQAELQKPLPLRRTVPRIWVAGVAVLMALAAFWLGRTL
ncbi:MAG: 2-polyprenylphenol 6-hydroxylase [Alphaproteobacteria bacterium]